MGLRNVKELVPWDYQLQDGGIVERKISEFGSLLDALKHFEDQQVEHVVGIVLDGSHDLDMMILGVSQPPIEKKGLSKSTKRKPKME